MQQASPRHHDRPRTASALSGAGVAMFGLGFLILAGTGAAIAWQQWGTPPRAEPIAEVFAPAIDLVPLQNQIVFLQEENRLIRAELDGLVGPDGVLPRIIGQLQEGRRLHVAHSAALQRLLSAEASYNPQVPQEVSVAPLGGPVQLTPVRALIAERPQRVIVTPETPNPPAGQGQ